MTIHALRGHNLVCRQSLGTFVLRRLHTLLIHLTLILSAISVNRKLNFHKIWSELQSVINWVNLVNSTPSIIVILDQNKKNRS